MINVEQTLAWQVYNKDENTAKKEQIIANINESYAKYIAKKANLYSNVISAAANLKTAKVNYLNPINLDKSKVDSLAYDPFKWAEAITNLANKELNISETLKPFEQKLESATKEFTVWVSAGVKAKYEPATATDVADLNSQVSALLG